MFSISGIPYCEICYSNYKSTHEEIRNFGKIWHSYPALYYKVKNNIEKAKKDKNYIENLLLKIKEKYVDSKEELIDAINESLETNNTDKLKMLLDQENLYRRKEEMKKQEEQKKEDR